MTKRAANSNIVYDASGMPTRLLIGRPVRSAADSEIVYDASGLPTRSFFGGAPIRMRQPADIGRIVRKRDIMHNQPTIAGTRIPTIAIWQFHKVGNTYAEIRRQYPLLLDQDIRAALDYERARRKKDAKRPRLRVSVIADRFLDGESATSLARAYGVDTLVIYEVLRCALSGKPFRRAAVKLKRKVKR